MTIEAEGRQTLSAFGPSPTSKPVRAFKGSKRIAKQMNYDLSDNRNCLAFGPYYLSVCCLYNCGGTCNENGCCAPPTIYQSSLATESPTPVKMDGPCCLMTQTKMSTEQSAPSTKMAWLGTSPSALHWTDNKLIQYRRKTGPALAMTNRVGIFAPCHSFYREMAATRSAPNVTKAQRREMDEIIRSIGGSRKKVMLPWQKRGSYAREQSSPEQRDGVNPGPKRSPSEAEEIAEKLAKLRAGTFIPAKVTRCAIPPESTYEQRVSMIAMGAKNVV